MKIITIQYPSTLHSYKFHIKEKHVMYLKELELFDFLSKPIGIYVVVHKKFPNSG
jgi:hypothetical protein